MKRCVLITDVDNTLYDFIEYYGPTFRAMVHVLSKETGIKEKTIRMSFRELYKETKTIEYKFAIQSLKIFERIDEEKMHRMIYIARLAYQRTKRKHLRLYDGVAETLRELINGGVSLCAISNAPIYHAYRRLLELGVLRFFDFIYAWEGIYDVKNKKDPYVEEYKKIRAKLDQSSNTGVSLLQELSSDERKPDSSAFERIVGEFGSDDVLYFAVGDSKEKDLYWPQRMGMTTIWAKYGKVSAGKNLDTVIDITHWDESKVKKEYRYSDIIVDYEIGAFSQLLNIVPHTKQLLLL